MSNTYLPFTYFTPAMMANCWFLEHELLSNLRASVYPVLFTPKMFPPLLYMATSFSSCDFFYKLGRSPNSHLPFFSIIASIPFHRLSKVVILHLFTLYSLCPLDCRLHEGRELCLPFPSGYMSGTAVGIWDCSRHLGGNLNPRP